ncbi:hypothetical protein B0H14DRAFT_3903800 [Mycena olivaceomarginata]|nr:hypothetical protein B0H14DRAFT_3903800 [Mycena olivaceomarginata]
MSHRTCLPSSISARLQRLSRLLLIDLPAPLNTYFSLTHYISRRSFLEPLPTPLSPAALLQRRPLASCPPPPLPTRCTYSQTQSALVASSAPPSPPLPPPARISKAAQRAPLEGGPGWRRKVGRSCAVAIVATNVLGATLEHQDGTEQIVVGTRRRTQEAAAGECSILTSNATVTERRRTS